MSTPNTKLMIPDRAIASVAFGCFSILTLRAFAHLVWLPVQGGSHISEQAIDAMSPILESLQITYRLLRLQHSSGAFGLGARSGGCQHPLRRYSQLWHCLMLF
jgi:hypothetical protein